MTFVSRNQDNNKLIAKSIKKFMNLKTLEKKMRKHYKYWNF